MSENIMEITTQQEFQDFITKHKVVVLNFYASWAGPCRMIGSYVQQRSHETGVPLANIEVERLEDIAHKYDVKSMPTYFALNLKQTIMNPVVGANKEKISNLFEVAKKYLQQPAIQKGEPEIQQQEKPEEKVQQKEQEPQKAEQKIPQQQEESSCRLI